MQVNNRLFEIVYILMQKKKVTAKELAEKFEVSTRTIYRDIESLSRANIPIYSSKGKDGGIGILEEYVLNKTVLSEEEQNQILFALQGMKKIAGEDKDILEKISTIFNKKVNDWIKIDFSNWGKEEKYKLKNIVLELEINKEMAYRVYDEFEDNEITKSEDGSFRVKVEYPETDWIYGYILSFGENIKVISPKRVKSTIKVRLEETLKNYL